MEQGLPNDDQSRRSQRWMRFLVNEQPAILNHAIRMATGISKEVEIDWRSPLRDDEYSEYFDRGFLERLGLTFSGAATRAILA